MLKTLRHSRYILGVSAFALLLPAAAFAKNITLTFEYPWPLASDPGAMFAKMAAEYHKRHPNIKVKMVPGAWHDKLLTQMAGGVSPDLFVITNPNVSPDALAKVAMPLGKYVKAAKIKASDFWAPSWAECFYEGEQYALPRQADANFGLYINKDAFRETGLPEKGPSTIAEYDNFAQKLTKVDPTSKAIKRMGGIPWWVYGYGNVLYTWGWCFGGEFYNENTKKVTLMNQGVVKALKWMKHFADLYGGINKTNVVIKGDESSSFNSGKIAMQPNGNWGITRANTEAPRLDYDIVDMPVDDGVTTNPTWVGGHKIIIPRGSKYPKEAFDFLRFVCADPVGTNLGPYGDMPAYRLSPAYKRMASEKKLSSFIRIVEKAAHIRPIIPVSDLLDTEMANAVTRVLGGKASPEVALQDAQKTVQANLDRVLKRYATRGK